MLPDIQFLFAKNCMMKMVHLFSLQNFTVQGIAVFFTMKNQASAPAVQIKFSTYPSSTLEWKQDNPK